MEKRYIIKEVFGEGFCSINERTGKYEIASHHKVTNKYFEICRFDTYESAEVAIRTIGAGYTLTIVEVFERAYSYS